MEGRTWLCRRRSTKFQLTYVNNDETLSGTNEEETPIKATAEERNVLELKEMLIDIQITVSSILRKNTKLTNVKSALSKSQKQHNVLETQLDAARKRIDDQEAEIAELFDLQDALEQYTRKNSLEIHGVPESAYTSTEEVVLKLAEAIDVDINPNDIEISHKLHKKGVKPIIVRFHSHKVKTQKLDTSR